MTSLALDDNTEEKTLTIQRDRTPTLIRAIADAAYTFGMKNMNLLIGTAYADPLPIPLTIEQPFISIKPVAAPGDERPYSVTQTSGTLSLYSGGVDRKKGDDISYIGSPDYALRISTSGIYLAQASFVFEQAGAPATNNLSNRTAWFMINGDTTKRYCYWDARAGQSTTASATITNLVAVTLSCILDLAATNKVSIFVYHTVSPSLKISAVENGRFILTKLQ